MMHIKRAAPLAALLILSVLLGPAGCTAKGRAPVILATTTSTQDSGLLDVLIPAFEQGSGYKVRTIAVGTGQALSMAERGDADVVLAHAPEAEKKVVAGGAAGQRRLVMYNDFVLAGPPMDPAGLRHASSAADGMRRIAGARALFISRGDDSGTHKVEKALWKAAGADPAGAWYQETGSGMGQTLSMASEKEAYILTDRATYLAMKPSLRLRVLLEGDPGLLNLYHVMVVSAQRFPRVNGPGAEALAAYLVSPDAQALIGSFGRERFGQPLFTPAAGKTEQELLGR